MTAPTVSQCEIKSDYKKDEQKTHKDWPIRKLLKELKKEIQAPPQWLAEAAKKFEEDIVFVEKEYDGIPQLVAEYGEAYPSYRKTGAKYCTAEGQVSDISAKIEDAKNKKGIDEKEIKAIEDLRTETYRDDSEDPLPDSHPKRVLKKAEQQFRSIKSCFDQRKEEEEEATGKYNKKKDFKKTVEGWFTDLKSLYDQAKGLFDQKKYKSLYAVYLEADVIWRKIKALSPEPPQGQNTQQPPKDPKWFKERLTTKLMTALIRKHERFRWHRDWLCKQNTVTRDKKEYEEFNTNRRKNFIRESEDVTSEPPGGGGSGSGTAPAGPTQGTEYMPPTPPSGGGTGGGGSESGVGPAYPTRSA